MNASDDTPARSGIRCHHFIEVDANGQESFGVISVASNRVYAPPQPRRSLLERVSGALRLLFRFRR